MDIRSASNQLIGSVRNGFVFDSQNKMVGSIDFRGTMDSNGRLISTSQVPGLLLK